MSAPDAPSRPDNAESLEELFEQARQVVGTLRARKSGRANNGRFLPGNTLTLRHGLYSDRLLDQPDVKAWHAQQVAQIEADLGGRGELTALARGLTREAARLEVLATCLGDDLLARGVLTAKGSSRAALTSYLKILDRLGGIAARLGLERRQKPVPALDRVVADIAARRQSDGTPDEP